MDKYRYSNFRLFILCMGLFSMIGCATGSYSDLKAELDDIRTKTPRPIEPLPEVKVYEIFHYSAASLRSPFEAPIDESLIIDIGNNQTERPVSTIKPKPHTPEYLEQFSIDTLKMVGSLQWSANELWALVSDGEGGIHQVKVGNYLGRNFGEIVAINEDKLEVRELVSDGDDLWLERPRALTLNEK